MISKPEILSYVISFHGKNYTETHNADLNSSTLRLKIEQKRNREGRSF